jgi:hypothetical protein
MNYDTLIVNSPGPGYRTVRPYSHYNEPIDHTDGRLAGNRAEDIGVSGRYWEDIEDIGVRLR